MDLTAVAEQRERNAAKAKAKVDQRREDASGAASWVAERAGDGAYVDEKCEEVRRSIQHGMDALARRRVFPVFG